MAKEAQRTKLILRTNLEEVDLSHLCFDMNLPRTPGEIESVQVQLVIDRLDVDEDGALTVHLKTD